MLLAYNFKESRSDPIPKLVDIARGRFNLDSIKWDTEIRFFEDVFQQVLAYRELATFRADNKNPNNLRLPAAVELPIVITRRNDDNYALQWGTVRLTKVWGGPLEDFPRIAAKLNNEPSYDAFINGALDYYCKLGGLKHMSSMYHIGPMTKGRIIEVPKPQL